jgi:hypothetical protein
MGPKKRYGDCAPRRRDYTPKKHNHGARRRHRKPNEGGGVKYSFNQNRPRRKLSGGGVCGGEGSSETVQ